MIRHVMKDGTVRQDITGYVVKMDQAKGVYSLLDMINRKQTGKSRREKETKR